MYTAGTGEEGDEARAGTANGGSWEAGKRVAQEEETCLWGHHKRKSS